MSVVELNLLIIQHSSQTVIPFLKHVIAGILVSISYKQTTVYVVVCGFTVYGQSNV